MVNQIRTSNIRRRLDIGIDLDKDGNEIGQQQSEIIRYVSMQDKQVTKDVDLETIRAKQVVLNAWHLSRYVALIGWYISSKLGGKFCGAYLVWNW